MDYIFHDGEAKLSILISCPKKGQEKFCIAEIECNNAHLKERYDDLADILEVRNGWELKPDLNKFVKDHVDEDIDFQKLMKRISKTLKEHEPMTPIELLNLIDDADYYPDTHNIDVTIGGQIFTIKDTDYQSAAKLKTWVMSQFRRILDIGDRDWKHIVKHIRDIASVGNADPTAPPILTTLLDLIENNNIYSDYCEDFVNSLMSGGSQMSFMLQEDILYVPSDIYDFLRKKYTMTYTTIRQYCEKYLINKTSSVVETRIIHGKKKSFRFWQFSFEKLWELRSTLSQKEVIQVTEEDKEKLYARE